MFSRPACVPAVRQQEQKARRGCGESDGVLGGTQVECLMSKVAALMGKEGDATPFTDVTVENISAALHKWASCC